MSPTGFQVVSISYAGTAAGGHLPSGFRSRVEPHQAAPVHQARADRQKQLLPFLCLFVCSNHLHDSVKKKKGNKGEEMRWQSDRTLLISASLGPAISINGGTQKNKVTAAQTNKQQPMALKSGARFCLMVTLEFF